jgi:hypothetical protein
VRLRPPPPQEDTGAGYVEYGGVVALIAVIATVLFFAWGGIAATVRDGATGAVCRILDSADCETETAGHTTSGSEAPLYSTVQANGPGAGITPLQDSPPQDCAPGGLGVDHDRRDTARDARRADNDRERRNGSPEETTGTCGPSPHQPSGLGDPVPGEQAPVPEPPAWEPVDEGAGEWGSEDSLASQAKARLMRALAESAANAMAGKWPNASRNLLHFLSNSGEPLEQDVDQMLNDVPQFRDEVDTTLENLAATAIAQAQAEGVDGPVTFPVNTAWTGFYISPSYSRDWFFALGGIQYNVTGQITVYPPSEPGGEWRYESRTQVNIRDQYNWDGGKSTQIGPFTVSDETLAEMHRVGIAREYLAYGQSQEEIREGTF